MNINVSLALDNVCGRFFFFGFTTAIRSGIHKDKIRFSKRCHSKQHLKFAVDKSTNQQFLNGGESGDTVSAFSGAVCNGIMRLLKV